MTNFNIDHNILNNSFNDYFNDNFRPINKDFSYKYDLGHGYDFYYPPESHQPLLYMDYPISRAGFDINEDNSINEVTLYMNIFDADVFFKECIKNYGKPNALIFKKEYLEKIEDEFSSENRNIVAETKVEEYKSLGRIIWYNVNDSVEKAETHLAITCSLKYEIMGTPEYEINVVFLK